MLSPSASGFSTLIPTVPLVAEEREHIPWGQGSQITFPALSLATNMLVTPTDSLGYSPQGHARSTYLTCKTQTHRAHTYTGHFTTRSFWPPYFFCPVSCLLTSLPPNLFLLLPSKPYFLDKPLSLFWLL